MTATMDLTRHQREILDRLERAVERLDDARRLPREWSRFTADSTPSRVARAIRDRNELVHQAALAGVSPRVIAEVAGIAGVRKVRAIVGVTA